MSITLKRAQFSDCGEIYAIQRSAFSALLNKYQDFDSNPGAEKIDYIEEKFRSSDFYFIVLDDKNIGALFVDNYGTAAVLNRICILPTFWGRGYAQSAILSAEKLYSAVRWELDTIAQEEKLCYLYEKLGYRKTGKSEHIKDGMDIVLYAKEI